jgi:phosphomannomutase
LKYRKTTAPDVVFSDVSTNMVKAICNKYCCIPTVVPTGFKHIGAKINEENTNFVFGFEESNGYLVGDYIRDKDSIGASVLICEMAAFYKKQNKTLINVLDELYQEFGYYGEKTISFQTNENFSFLNVLNKMVNIRFQSINLTSNMLVLEYRDETEIIFRKSGTEPKIKVYIKVLGESKEEMEYKLAEYCDAIQRLGVI